MNLDPQPCHAHISTHTVGPRTPLERCPALVLNADYRPLSYFPLSLWPWQEAVKAIFRDTVTVISEYERVVDRRAGKSDCQVFLP